MKIENETKYMERKAPEKEEVFYLHFSSDPKVNHLVYFSRNKDTKEPCDYLKTWGHEMTRIKITGTNSEALAERSRLEEERRAERYRE